MLKGISVMTSVYAQDTFPLLTVYHKGYYDQKIIKSILAHFSSDVLLQDNHHSSNFF